MRSSIFPPSCIHYNLEFNQGMTAIKCVNPAMIDGVGHGWLCAMHSESQDTSIRRQKRHHYNSGQAQVDQIVGHDERMMRVGEFERVRLEVKGVYIIYQVMPSNIDTKFRAMELQDIEDDLVTINILASLR